MLRSETQLRKITMKKKKKGNDSYFALDNQLPIVATLSLVSLHHYSKQIIIVEADKNKRLKVT